MGNVKIVQGDLFQYQGHKAHGVNCYGVMGAGIAKIFKKKYPEMYQSYRDACTHNKLFPGGCFPAKENGEIIFNLAVKDHWKNPSKLQWVQGAVNFMVMRMKDMGVKEVAMPWVGCGLGGLNKDDVYDILVKAVEWEDDDMIIWVYEK